MSRIFTTLFVAFVMAQFSNNFVLHVRNRARHGKEVLWTTTRATWSARRTRESPGRDKQPFFSFFFIVILVSQFMKHNHSLVLPSTPHGVARPELLRRPTESGTSEVRRLCASHLRGLGCSWRAVAGLSKVSNLNSSESFVVHAQKEPRRGRGPCRVRVRHPEIPQT